MIEIEQLLTITETLKKKYGRSFTLDGKLVGDIGEVLVAEKYGLTLLDENNNTHDATHPNGRNIQIKSSFLNKSYFPTGIIPDYFIAVRIYKDGTIEELFNGKGVYVYQNYIVARGLRNNGQYLYTLSGTILRTLNERAPIEDKIHNLNQ
jgi:hypothetical protein